ncbi:M48 family metallopeptidase [Massilia sp. Leaf139]|uniref:M48 family metallopeptidase n=1 Tax=Massilia sp. Leaf139 TaxID=1736272 RepID=UPI000701F04E|nr:SprT family zinc-dependent metalloprotease [Massilia sp. Leaf139]KQQ87482.1 metal-dependent hydrolase [Massilia sp. Leaf139]
MNSPKIAGPQLDLFAQPSSTQDPFQRILHAPPAPAAKPVPPQPLFKAPPSPPRINFPSPPRTPDDPPLRRIVLGHYAVDYELKRSARRSIGFMIDDDGLHVTAPRRAILPDIDNAIRAKQRWILTKLHERGERRAKRAESAPLVWEDGARLPYLGAEIVLRLKPAARSHCVFDAETRELRVGVTPGLTEWQIKELVKIWFQAEAKRLFTERLDFYAPQLGVRYSALTLSSAGTRWGSCTIGGSIRLNWRLVHYALPLLDYVVVHELAHLREMNHSPRFWAVVGSVYADYDGARLELRRRSHEMPVLFTD